MGALQFSHKVRDAVDSWKGKIHSYEEKYKFRERFPGGQLSQTGLEKKAEKTRKMITKIT